MVPPSSNVVITGGSFSTQATPQAHASVANIPERGGVPISTRDETSRVPDNISSEEVERPSPPSHIIYTEQLSKKDRGHAFWFPDPAVDLPDEYREEGVCIGDVGIMDPSGAFIFLFNINKPAEHPVNCDRPSDFQPLDPPLQQNDITETKIFSAGSFLASEFVKRVQSDTLKGGLAFESSATEGAILAMPDATFRSDLKDLDRFYQQIGIHAESWYSYANGPGMGHLVRNGDLCLVIGCDKTTSWGIMTFSNSLEQTTSRFQFQPVTSSDSTGRHYTWEHSGTADSPRVGPGGGQSSRNQCLFVRYLNIKLRAGVGPGFNEPTGAQIQMELHQSTSLRSKQSNSPNVSSFRKFGSMLSQFLWSVLSPSGKESEAPPGLSDSEDSLEITKFQKNSSFSNYLNDHLLQSTSGAKVAASRGVEWYSKYISVNEPASSMSGFLSNVLSDNEVCLESGIAYFRPKSLLPWKTRTMQQATNSTGSFLDYATEIQVGDLTPDDIIILVLGVTGAGKSTFIWHCTGHDPGICHGLSSSVEGIKMVKIHNPKLHGPSLVFVDTPGFDNSEPQLMSDENIEKMILAWHEKLQRRRIPIAALVTLQKVMDEIPPQTAQHMEKLDDLCTGPIIFATTMWDFYRDDDATGGVIENRPRTKYWADRLSRGAVVVRLKSKEDVLSIRDRILDGTFVPQ